MHTYELMVILHPDIDPTDDKKRDALISKMLGEAAKTVKETKTLGKKSFSYPIAKQTQGTYVLLKLEGESVKTADLEKNRKMIPEVLRFLLTVQEA